MCPAGHMRRPTRLGPLRWICSAERALHSGAARPSPPPSHVPWHPAPALAPWSAARIRCEQERYKREEIEFESSPRSPPHLQENEPQKPLICNAQESCTPPLLRVITHPTVDKAKPGAQEFAHCSEGGRSTQGSAELTAPALPMQRLSDRSDGRDARRQPRLAQTGAFARSGPRSDEVADSPRATAPPLRRFQLVPSAGSLLPADATASPYRCSRALLATRGG